MFQSCSVCIEERFFRLSTQGKICIETVVNLENAVNEVIRNTEKSIRKTIRQIGYSMLLYDYEKKGFNKYRLISNDDACDECKGRGSHTYELDKLSDIEFSPLVHPNCRCTVEIIDDRNRFMAIIDDKAVEEQLQILGIAKGDDFWDYLHKLYSPLILFQTLITLVI